MRHKFPLPIFLLLFFICLLPLHSNPVAEVDLLHAGSRWLQLSGLLPDRQLADLSDGARSLRSNFSWDTIILLPLHPSGYLVMSTDDHLPPVIAFSETSLSENRFVSAHPFHALLQAQDEHFSAVISQPATRGGNDAFAANGILWQQLLDVPPTRAAPIVPPAGSILQPPLLSTIWDQDLPFDHYTPSAPGNIYERAPVGCVPLTIAQILKFHQWPYRGQGSKNHADSEKSLHAQLAADLSRPFGWESMPNSLVDFAGLAPSPTVKLLAQACLAFGVFLGSDYELWGTATFPNSIAAMFANNLFFQSDDFKMSEISPNYLNYIAPAILYANIKTDILAKRPVYVGFSESAIDGHSFIADGLAQFSGQNYYHLNYGWGGRENGWFLLTSGYLNSAITNGITNIQPQFMAQFEEMPYEQTPELTLQWQFPQYHANEVTAFRLQATRNGWTSTLTEQIPPAARNWSLTDQPLGEVKYTITAKKGAASTWQGGDSIQLLITTAPQERIVRLQPIISKQTVTRPFELEITLPDLPGIALNAKTSRPDIYPEQNCVITGQGTNRTLTLTPAMTTRAGNILVWVTASKDNWQTQVTADLTALYPEVPLQGAGEAVGNQQQDFFTDGHVSWKVQTKTYATPPKALHIDNYDLTGISSLTEFARLYTYVTGPCRVEFKWRVSSTPQSPTYPDSGYLIFTVNDTELERISGQSTWETAVFTIEQPGEHILSWILPWTYWPIENGNYTLNRNQAWLDDFSWKALYPVTVNGGQAETEFAGPAAEILAAAEDEVTITAISPHPECNFQRWETEPPNVPLANAVANPTTFIMPAQAVQVRSCFLRTLDIALTTGWNLISLPVTLTQDSTAKLSDFLIFSCQSPNGQRQYSRVIDFPPGQAYWLYTQQYPPDVLVLQGAFAPLPTQPTSSGWHLFAPGEEKELPDNTLAWKWNGAAYEPVTDGTLRPPQAYWLWVDD